MRAASFEAASKAGKVISEIKAFMKFSRLCSILLKSSDNTAPFRGWIFISRVEEIQSYHALDMPAPNSTAIGSYRRFVSCLLGI